MFRYDLRLFLAAGAVLVTVAAVGAQSQVAKSEEPGSTPDQRIQGLENELVELRRLVGRYQTQLAHVLVADERAREVARLQVSEEEARNELIRVEEQLVRVEELHQVTRAELEVAGKDRIDLQAQVARLAKRFEDQPGERAQLQEERERLTTQLVVLGEELKRERVRQDAEVERVRQGAITLEGQLRRAMAENERLQGRYLATTESLATLQDGFQLISADAESTRQQLRRAQGREQKLEQQLAAIQDDRAATVENKELLAALAAAQSARREQTDEIIRVRAELRAVSKEREELSSEIKVAAVENAALQQKGAETEVLVAKLSAQIEETVGVREELQKLQQQKVEFEATLRGLRDQSSELVAALEKVNTARIQQERESGRLRSELASAVALRKQLEPALEKANAARVQQEQESDRLRGELASAVAIKRQLESALEKANAARVQQEQESDRLRGELASAVALKRQLESTLKASSEAQQKLQGRQERVDAALADVRGRLHQTLANAATTQKQLMAAKKEAATLVTGLQDQIEKRKAELAQALGRLQARDTQAQADVGRLELVMSKATEENKRLAGALKERTAELATAQQDLAGVQAESRAVTIRSGEQSQEIRRLTVALKRASEEKESLAGTLKKWEAQRREANETLTGLQARVESAGSQLQQNAQKIGSLEVALKAAQGAKEAEVAARVELEASLQSARDAGESWRQQQMAAAATLAEVNVLLDKLKAEKIAADQKLQALSEEKQGVAKAIKKSYEQAIKELGPEVEQNAITVIEGPDRMTIRVGGGALFSPGQASLRPQSRAMLDKVVGLLKEFPDYDVRAEGHTDSTGNWSANWELSALRAGAVVRYLQEKGIKPERLASTGYAFYRPVASNDTPEGRAANRRIEITLEPKE